jgi:hypothetical protein
MTGVAKPGAILETRAYDDAGGHKRLSLATRSDLSFTSFSTIEDAEMRNVLTGVDVEGADEHSCDAVW